MPTTFLSARWENLIMVNYQVEAGLLEPFLPAGVELDAFQGKTYVSLVGFLFKNTRLFGIPVPFFGSFEEINLRFYVKRQTEQGTRRGVVFINETVPYRAVAWLANKLYKEHYTAVPTRHKWERDAQLVKLHYEWTQRGRRNFVSIEADVLAETMKAGSAEEFIFEHYFGYTRINERETEEYQVQHPRWNIMPLRRYEVDCDFAAMYGADFGFLGGLKPDSVMLAEGSPVKVLWKRYKI
jgi:uncharacterized protein YqjF (DUF2071 family)